MGRILHSNVEARPGQLIPGEVSVGSSTTGVIHYIGDRDWFEVDLVAGNIYRIELDGGTGDGELHDPYLYGILDAHGVLIPDTANDDAGVRFDRQEDSRVYFQPQEDGTYYVNAGGDRHSTGEYTVRVARVTLADDYKGTPATTGTVAVGGSATGRFNFEGDMDWFAVTLEGGKSYEIDLISDTADESFEDLAIRGITDSDGTYPYLPGTTDQSWGASSRILFTPDENGTYYIVAGASTRLMPTEPYRSSTYASYELSVGEFTDDYSSDTETTGSVTVGASATGEINVSDDRDWFAVELEADTRYRVDLEGSSTDQGTLSDPYLRAIRNEDGDYLPGTYNNDGGSGRNSQVHFTPEEAGTYYIEASGEGDATGTYTLSVVEDAL